MNYDSVEKLEGHAIQHGPLNDRVYLMKMAKDTPPGKAIKAIEKLAQRNNYGKIFAKVGQRHWKSFQRDGYQIEAKVPRMYQGQEDVYFFSKYLDKTRKRDDFTKIAAIVTMAHQKGEQTPKHSNSHTVVELYSTHVPQVVQVYRKVFASYPFPIFEEAYVEASLKDNVRVFGILENDQLAAVASCEIDYEGRNVEMTDFATLPQHRGQGHAVALLTHMEKQMRGAKMQTAYTIARSQSPGMNITFSRANYQFSGTLVKNTSISSGIESMNVWYKHL